MATHHSDLLRFAGRALTIGGRRTKPNRVDLNIAGNCSNPNTLERYARPPRSQQEAWIVVKKGSKVPFTVEVTARCGKCDNCREAHAYHWRMRMISEWRTAPRTWLSTFTAKPDLHHLWLVENRQRFDGGQVDYDNLPDLERFRYHAASMGREFTKYLKRLRKAGVQVRYCQVTERHEGGGAAHGFPHLHALIHDYGEAKKAMLEEQWSRIGFSSHKLAPDLAACWYVAKYINKSHSARVRASVRYGHASLSDFRPVVES